MIFGAQLTSLLLISHWAFSVPLANVAGLLVPLAKVDDPTGVNTAMLGIANLFVGFLGGTLAVILAIEGYQYMFSDSASRGVHLKRMLAIVLGGTMLVLLAVKIAPVIISIVTGK